jgi:transcription initiation factor TFIIIB Brf1 subunit/transcription initiation factor TFIIB
MDNQTCPKCHSSNIVDYDDGKVCRNCGKTFKYIMKDEVFCFQEVHTTSYTDEELKNAIWE